jgi:hypothetical protein
VKSGQYTQIRETSTKEQNFGFTLEARKSFRIVPRYRRQTLMATWRASFVSLISAVHLAHAAGTDGREDFIGAKLVA